MDQHINASKSYPLIWVTGVLVACLGAAGLIFTVFALLAGGFSFPITGTSLFLTIVGLEIQRMKRWSLYGLTILLLWFIAYLVHEFNNGTIGLSPALLIVVAPPLLATLYCWQKRALFS